MSAAEGAEGAQPAAGGAGPVGAPAATAAEAAPLPDLAQQVLVVQAGGERLGFVLREVAWVVERQRLSAVPKAPPGVLGIMNHLGTVVTVASLTALLGLPEAAPGPLVVVLESRDVRVGLVVERVEGVTLELDPAADVASAPPAGAAAGPAALPFARGFVLHEGAPVRLLDGAAIVDEVVARFEAGGGADRV